MLGKRGRNMNGRTVKIGNMKYSEREIRQNKSGKRRKICTKIFAIHEQKVRDYSLYQSSN
jgi:hypothetical protein